MYGHGRGESNGMEFVLVILLVVVVVIALVMLFVPTADTEISYDSHALGAEIQIDYSDFESENALIWRCIPYETGQEFMMLEILDFEDSTFQFRKSITPDIHRDLGLWYTVITETNKLEVEVVSIIKTPIDTITSPLERVGNIDLSEDDPIVFRITPHVVEEVVEEVILENDEILVEGEVAEDLDQEVEEVQPPDIVIIHQIQGICPEPLKETSPSLM